MRHCLFWAAFPFIIPQALHVRRTAPRFARAAGPREGTVGDGDSHRLLGVGDSIIAGVGARNLTDALVGQTAAALADRLACRVEWSARGAIGATSRSVLEKIVPRLPPQPAAFVVLSVGVNDITGLRTLAAWKQTLNTLLTRLHQHSPHAIIAVAGIPPLHGFPLLPQPMRTVFGFRGRCFDTAARQVVDQHACAVYIPLDVDPHPSQFSADGYHPSEASYHEFGERTARLLAESARR